jgi:predicted nuclease with TOPRIM domain
VEFFDQLEKKVQARAEERAGLLQENERLRQEISRQAKDMKRLKSELSEGERIEQEVKDRVDNLIKFLEALSALKD